MPLARSDKAREQKRKQEGPMSEPNRVVLTVPVLGEFARTVRIAAAELAARAEMSLDCVEDVRLAVEEAFVFARARAQGPSLTFTFDLEPGVIALEVGPLQTTVVEDGPDRAERYARFLLESICDEFELLSDDGSPRLRLVKRSS
jgi:serine/threonine-protein kinase RsbW